MQKIAYIIGLIISTILLNACVAAQGIHLVTPAAEVSPPLQEIVVTHEGKTTADRCTPAEIAEIVMRFLDAKNRGDRAALAQFFGDNFQWYSIGEYNTQEARLTHRVGYIAEEANTNGGTVRGLRKEIIPQLLDYFAERHAQHEQMQLLEIASVGGGGDMYYKIQRRSEDLDPKLWGPDFIATGKGFVDCNNQTIDVWSMAMNTPSPSLPTYAVCPTPTAEKPQAAVLTCTHDWK